MLLPTMNVRRKLDGHVCVINVSDFDPELHTDLDAINAAEEMGEQVNITDLNQVRAIEHLDTLVSLEELDVVEAQEKANTKHPGGRVSILREIEKTRERLTA